MTAHGSWMHGAEPEIDWNRLSVIHTEHLHHVSDIIFLIGTSQCQYPFPDFLGASHTWNILQFHFNWKYWGFILKILEEHPSPFPKCERCGSHVLPWRLNNRHYGSDQCWLGEDQRRWQETLRQCFESSRLIISVNSEPMDPILSFLYLVRTIE